MKRLLIILQLVILSFALQGQVLPGVVAGQSVVTSSTLNTGLIAYFKFDETTGTNLNEEVANNDATANADADVNATGKLGKAIDFTPDGGAISLVDEIFSTVTTMDFSVSFWIKFDVLNLAERRIFSFLDGTLAPLFEAQISDAGVVAFVANNTVPTQFYQVTAAETNTTDFIHYVFTCKSEADGIHIYRNGVEADTRTDNPTGSAPAFHATIQTIGNYFNGGSNSIDGKMDEFGIWNRALTTTEVTSLYNSGSGKTYPF